MDSGEATKIIAADFMYLVFLGDDEIIGKLAEKLNKDVNESIDASKKNKTYKSGKPQAKAIYVKHDICTPCIDMLDSEQIQTILKEDAINQIKKIRSNEKSKNVVISDDDIDVYKKYVVPDESVESAQCLTYADVSCTDRAVSKRRTQIKDLMMLMVMNETDTHYKLSFPVLQLDEEEDPDRVISRWLKEHDVEELIKELTIRLVNIVGNVHEILVFTAFVNE
ncbi:hypothetical protein YASMINEVIRUS_992 [Yasminevirus sp. GU-2018]|uniref:Uncharacterized protein n=1 Tax=Yasminevirus sp. GU-2018 TaxID=2420051 RepID=A0A5K0U8Q1_9VIRU|nr:hypothetical protein YASMINEVIRUS_992 [Yasminevirus sp. GU-2018]